MASRTHGHSFTVVAPPLASLFGVDLAEGKDFMAIGVEQREAVSINGSWGDQSVLTQRQRCMSIAFADGSQAIEFDAEVVDCRETKPPRKTKKALAKHWEERGPRERRLVERFRTHVSVSMRPAPR